MGCLLRAGSYDHFLNFQIAFVIMLQIAMCVFCAVASYVWREQYGKQRYFLALDVYVQVRHPRPLHWQLLACCQELL